MRNLEEFNGRHSGEPCCIIASGPSVNMVSSELFRHFITIGVNAGMLAYTDANYFVSDDPDCAKWSYFSDLRRLNCDVLLYEDRFIPFRETFGDRVVFFRHRRGYHVTDEYHHEDYDNHILQCRSSVGSAIHIAHIMKCSPIFVLGIDCTRLSGKRWFWEFWPAKNRPKRMDGRMPDHFRKVKDTDADLMQILDYWQVQGEKILESCLVYNSSPLSKISVFPKMTIKQFIDSGRQIRV